MFKIALHIGLPKTATTSLQNNVLYPAHIEGKINFLGRSGEPFTVEYYNPFEDIFSKLSNEEMSESEISELQTELSKHLSEDVLNVICEEGLSLTQGFHYTRLENLKKILGFCDVKVLVSLRSPLDFFFSYYSEMYRWDFHANNSIDTIEKFVEKLLCDPVNEDFDILFFDRFLSKVGTLFPSLKVILFEDLKQDRKHFCDEMSIFFDLDSSYVEEKFSGMKENVGVQGQLGKFSQRITLFQKLEVMINSFVGEDKRAFLKRSKIINWTYNRIMRLSRLIPVSSMVEHKLLDEGRLNDLRDCLLMDPSFSLVFDIDKKKLESYGYLTRASKRQTVNPPLVSCCLITYNQEKFIKSAMDSVLGQSYSNLEVVISDDNSSDSTFDVINNHIKPSSKPLVKVNSNSVNQGINAHVNTVVDLSEGQFIVISSGDDISIPNRVEKLVKEWESGAVGVFSNAEVIDEIGNPQGLFVQQGYKHLATWKEMVAAGTHGAWGCTFSWDRKVFDLFGPLPLNILGEDAAIPFRCALLGRVSYIDEALVQYRDHGNNVSFWAQMKKSSGAGLRKIGVNAIQFDQVMYANWREDIGKAASADIITSADLEWAEEQLRVHESIRAVQLQLLQSSLLHALFKCAKQLWFKRSSDNRKQWMKRLIGTLLAFRMPRLYQVLLYIRGINRG